MAKYPKFLMEHFQNPKNVGEIIDPDGVGTVGNAHCGDIMQMYIKASGHKITDAKFKTFGCGAAIATSSILTERIKGATLDEALRISEETSREVLVRIAQREDPLFHSGDRCPEIGDRGVPLQTGGDSRKGWLRFHGI